MRINVKILFWIAVGLVTLTSGLKCAYESGEAAAVQRYLDATKKVDDCRAAGGERAACQSSFGRW